MRWQLILGMACMMMLGGCSRGIGIGPWKLFASKPAPAYRQAFESKHLRTIDGGFHYNREARNMYVDIVVALKDSLPEEARLVAHFHTPRGNAVVQHVVNVHDWAEGRVRLQSPAMFGWQAGNFPVTIEVYDDTRHIDRLVQPLVLEKELEPAIEKTWVQRADYGTPPERNATQ